MNYPANYYILLLADGSIVFSNVVKLFFSAR